MPIIREVEGNLLDMFDAGEFDVIIHGCNCRSIMGAGIAQQIAQRYPLVAQMDAYIRSGLGSILTVPLNGNQAVINGYTQLYPGRTPIDGEDRLEAIRSVFDRTNKWSLQFDRKLRFGIPLIGAGLAGGHWPDIEKTINEASPDMDITLVRYKP